MTGAVKEADLAKLELTEQAEKRLGVITVEAKRQPVPRAISYGGEVMIPPGRLINVASPFLGTVEAAPNAKVPLPGADRSSRASRSSSSSRSFFAQGAGHAGPAAQGGRRAGQGGPRSSSRSSRPNSSRAEDGVRQKLMTQASLIDARANRDVAVTACGPPSRGAARSATSPAITNAGGGDGHAHLRGGEQVKGVLQNIHAQVGQPVPAGTLLFDVAELNPILGPGAGVRRRPGAAGAGHAGGHRQPRGPARREGPARPARRRQATPSGDPLAATVFDLLQ